MIVNRPNPPSAYPSNVAAAVLTSQIFPNALNPLVPLTLTLPGSGVYEQKKVTVRAAGHAKTNAAGTTGLVTLFAGVTIPAAPFTPASWTLIAASTARIIATTDAPFFFEAELIFASSVNDGKLQGIFSCMNNNLYDAKAAITNPLLALTTINAVITPGSTNEPVCFFALGYTFGVNADVLNVATLTNFDLIAD